MIQNSIDFGVCRLSIVPVRKEPAHRAEQVSQLLFGEHYEVIEISKDQNWLLIQVYYDGFNGWIDARQHHSISKEYFEHINKADFKITTDLVTSILYNKSPLHILIGSIIPISGSELFKMEEQFAFNGEAKSLGVKRDVESLISIAGKYLHAPYQKGGKSPFGIDAPGLVQMVFKISGYRLGRTVQEQLRQGREIKNPSDAQPGDIVFFNTSGKNKAHPAIVISHNKVVHVYGQVQVDSWNEQRKLIPSNKGEGYSILTIRRILTE